MQPLGVFDTVFSMGVLYHRKSPFEHFAQLKNQLRAGGELVLETLVIDGDENTVLVPQDRYAKMKNVYFIPSVNALILWLENESLIDFLDPNDHSKTIEGYPAPKRAVILANK